MTTINSVVTKHIVTPLEGNMENKNLVNLVLFYLTKLLQSGDMKMTIDQLQADIKVLNGLLDAISAVFPNAQSNNVIKFLEAADSNPILQNIILLVVNNLIPANSPHGASCCDK